MLTAPRVLLSKTAECVSGNDVENDPRVSCNGGEFKLSMGYYIPCRAHKHCYGAREPPNWCTSNYSWTQFGCHCDNKIGSCVVERYQQLGENLEWSYCIKNEEFYCASSSPKFNTQKAIPTTEQPPETTVDNLVEDFRA
ncbi:hypothetical protein M3Y97_00561600 [Aphelenchoides bicaudatus]|nr:hypothetical protein M3Y97_00561600 [Aphelenchoides bicaudatus]